MIMIPLLYISIETAVENYHKQYSFKMFYREKRTSGSHVYISQLKYK